MLTRLAVVNSEKTFKIEKILTPGWNLDGSDPAEAFVYVRTLSGTSADDIRKAAKEHNKADTNDKLARALARWCVLGVCDENGEPFYTEADIPSLAVRPFTPLFDCSHAVMRLNGVTAEAEAAQKKD